ncbi:hypothetical protein C8J57DRAFT_1732647 [Mycena rebaudengoi]|nr:hypothetical protein C8J57DRAFT_1732647 [Mycena rebaudengoi]
MYCAPEFVRTALLPRLSAPDPEWAAIGITTDGGLCNRSARTRPIPAPVLVLTTSSLRPCCLIPPVSSGIRIPQRAFDGLAAPRPARSSSSRVLVLAARESTPSARRVRQDDGGEGRGGEDEERSATRRRIPSARGTSTSTEKWNRDVRLYLVTTAAYIPNSHPDLHRARARASLASTCASRLASALPLASDWLYSLALCSCCAPVLHAPRRRARSMWSAPWILACWRYSRQRNPAPAPLDFPPIPPHRQRGDLPDEQPTHRGIHLPPFVELSVRLVYPRSLGETSMGVRRTQGYPKTSARNAMLRWSHYFETDGASPSFGEN